jgi:predicted RNA-binding protein with PIN domain
MREILIDGYNLIRQSGRLSEQERRGGLEAGRAALIRALAAYRAATGDRVIAVFDGDEGVGVVTGARRQEGVSVIFSRPPESADDVIVAQVRKRHGKKAVLVVSSDRKILDAARRNRVAGMRSEAFEEEMARRVAEGPTQGRPGAKLKPEPDAEEVAYWEKVFRTRKGMFEEGTE